MERKIGLYLVSLWLLFVSIIIITVQIPTCFSENCKFIGVWDAILLNILPTICLVILLFSWAYYRMVFKRDLDRSTNNPFKITNIESINYEHLAFLATYIIPLISFEFDEIRFLIVLLVLLIAMGMIYIKTDLFYANPSLALLGFKIYKANGNFKGNETRENIILITNNTLDIEDRVKYIQLDYRIYYVIKN
tara:strand:+ start:205 stop:780 length:576 start_codon:yes stop_codon:yes gene_type:complete